MKDFLAALVAVFLAIKDALGGFLLGISLEQVKEANRGIRSYKTRQEVEDEVDLMPFNAVNDELRDKWTRK